MKVIKTKNNIKNKDTSEITKDLRQHQNFDNIKNVKDRKYDNLIESIMLLGVKGKLLVEP